MDELGAYRVLRVADPDGPSRAPGQFAMLAAERRWGGGEGERPFLARAFSVARAGRIGQAHFLLEDVGPGTHRLCELRRGRASCGLLGPLGVGFAAPQDGPPGDPRRRRRRHRAAGDPPGRARGAGVDDDGAARLPRRRARRAAPRCCEARASPPTMVRPATTASSPNCSREQLDRDPHAARSTRAGRRRCSRPCARSAPSAPCPPSSRWSQGWPAASAPASAASCPVVAGATCGCASTARSSMRRELERVEEHAGSPGMSVELLWPGARASDHQRFGHVRRARRPARPSARACSREDFPFAAFVSKTITLAPRAGNPSPRLWEAQAGLINSIGLPNKGLEGYLADDLPALARSRATAAPTTPPCR